MLAQLLPIITPLFLSSIRKFRASLSGSGCFVHYGSQLFFVTIKHAFNQGLKDGDKTSIQICDTGWISFTGLFFHHDKADVAVVKIQEDAVSQNYISMSVHDKILENRTGLMLGYENIDQDSCSELPFLQEVAFYEERGSHEVVYGGVAFSGYSGSPILFPSHDNKSLVFVGFLSKNSRNKFELQSDTQPKEENRFVILHDYKIISPSRQAIIETLNKAFA